MKTAEALRGKEELVLSHFNWHVTGNKHIDCPICGRKKDFRISRNKYGVGWICVCGHGSLIDLVEQTQGMQFRDAASLIDRIIGNNHHFEKPIGPTPSERLRAKIQKLSPLDGQAKKYLEGRDITQMPKYGVYSSHREWHKESQRGYECMYSISMDDNFNFRKVHLTYLENNNKIKAPPARKLYTVNEGSGAIRMFDPDSYMGVGEGIESSLSASMIDNLPVWATLNRALLAKFRAPKGVKTLVVYADWECHGSGLTDAMICARSNIFAKNDVQTAYVRWTTAGDFNDLLRDPSGQRFEIRLDRE
jgi:putative DNA primase/helicase